MVFVDKIPTEERFARLVMWGDDDDCWPWVGSLDKHGYGQFNRKGRNWRAHKWLHHHLTGETTLDLDHRCRNKRCVNPNHLDAVSHAENTKRSNVPSSMIRAGVCESGHDARTGRWRRTKRGMLVCRQCNSDSAMRRYRRAKSAKD